jgi:hypothetical protein
VNLRNLVPNWLDDGPTPGADGPNEVSEARAYHNFLPMITDGFNINQIRMSSTVGLSAQRVAQLPTRADGSNVGLNGAVVAAAPDSNLPGSPFDLPASSFPRQGSLVPPCSGSPMLDGVNETRCKLHMVWSTTDYRFEGKVPYLLVEFGALPLRSFGDPIKHPAHGLIGALVIGPEGSEVCATNRFARSPLRLPDGQTKPVPAGASAEVCKADGRSYVDHVLIMQDAVSATRSGLPVSNLAGAEEPDDYGMKAINYRTEPLWARRGNEPSVQFSERNDFDYGSVLSSAWSTDESGFRCKAGILPLLSKKYPCDPETPVLEASPGETVRLNIVHAGGHTRQQGLALSRPS